MKPPGMNNVIVAYRSVCDGLVHPDARCRLVQIHAAYASSPQRNDVHLGALRAQCGDGNGKFHLLEPVRRQHRNAAPLELAFKQHSLPSASIVGTAAAGAGADGATVVSHGRGHTDENAGARR